MGRYFNNIKSHKNNEQINSIINSYLASEGFKLVNYHSEQVWKRGVFFSNKQYIKIDLAENVVHVEAWLETFPLYGKSLGEITPMTQLDLGFLLRIDFLLPFAITKLKYNVLKLELALK